MLMFITITNRSYLPVSAEDDDCALLEKRRIGAIMNNVRKKDENRNMTQDMFSCSSVIIALSSSLPTYKWRRPH